MALPVKGDITLQNVVEDGLAPYAAAQQDGNHGGVQPKVRKMYFAALAALIMAVAMGFATGWSAPATYDMLTDPDSPVKPSDADVTWIGSILALGAMIGGICAGTLADKIGRACTLMINIVPFLTGWLIIANANSPTVVFIGRFFCGFSCGVISVTVPMYCVEISTSGVRGLLGSAFQGFLVIGSLMSATFGSYVSWIYLSLIAAICAVVGLICLSFMPETPRWLLAKGRLDDAISVMQELQGPSENADAECKEIFKDLENQPKGALTMKEFKEPTVYKPAIISFVMMFFQQFSGANAVFFYSSSIFDVSKDFLDPKKATIILNVVQVIATLFGNFIVDRAGRKLLLLLSGLFMAVSLAALGAYYFMSNKHVAGIEHYNWAPLVSLMFFVVAFSVGYGSIPWLLVPEMVPVRARSVVSGIATFANGIFAFAVTKTFSDIKYLIGTSFTFWTYSVITVLGLIFTAFMVPETKGKRLEEVSKMFEKK